MIGHATATGRGRVVCGPVARWVVVTTIGWTALIFLGALWASFTALAALAERGGIEAGQAWGWVLPVALAAAIWAVPSPLVLLAKTHSTVEQTSYTRTGPRGERASDAKVASWAVAVGGTSRQQRREPCGNGARRDGRTSSSSATALSSIPSTTPGAGHER